MIVTPGDLYVFKTGDDLGLEWLAVRLHPDAPSLVLLAPADGFHLAGTPDINVSPSMGRPFTVRGGQTEWVSTENCKHRVGSVRPFLLKMVRQHLADFVRGYLTEARTEIDNDPEYEEWIGNVARARVTIGA